MIWAGTDDGLIHRTADGGKTWTDVTPPGAHAVEQGVDDRGLATSTTLTAYAAVNRFRLDDLKPHIYRTHDGGKTWTEIVNGLPDGPRQRRPRGSGADRAALRRHRAQVYVSFDDGETLAVAAAQHAGHVDARSRRSRTTTSSSARTAAASGSSTT